MLLTGSAIIEHKNGSKMTVNLDDCKSIKYEVFDGHTVFVVTMANGETRYFPVDVFTFHKM